jgi:NADPH-dependent curcumin reductase CurA
LRSYTNPSLGCSGFSGNAGISEQDDPVADSLENAPQAFICLLEGKSFGRLVNRVTKDEFT